MEADNQASSDADTMAPEQAADLRRLQLAAGEPNADIQALEDAEAAQAAAELDVQTDQNSKAVRMGLDVAIPFLCKLYPSLEAIYDEQARAAVATTVGPVLSKYGVDLGDIGGRYKEEIAMVLVCGPIAVATYQGVKADIEAREKRVPKAVASTSSGAPQAAEPVKLG